MDLVVKMGLLVTFQPVRSQVQPIPLLMEVNKVMEIIMTRSVIDIRVNTAIFSQKWHNLGGRTKFSTKRKNSITFLGETSLQNSPVIKSLKINLSIHAELMET